MKPLSEIIRAEIAANGGVLPFARFMELALYCPEYGYYEQQRDTVGRCGDFITSASIGELFGQLLAFQFANWLPESKIRIIEAGAHDGKLARDILNWLQHNRPKLFSEIEYLILEPSPRRQAWQKETLKDFVPRVRWFSRFSDPTVQQSNGIIFCNELLDAMPLNRFGWDAKNKKWFGWGIAAKGEKFIWRRMSEEIRKARITTHAPPELLDVLPDNYTIETSPSAENWWGNAAGILARGKLLAIDYGLTDGEMFSPARTNGTLRAYFRHHISDNLLSNVGEQDLTAHINFSAIQKAGEEAGLKTETFCTQTQFLTQILAQAQKDKSFGEWNASRTRQFQTLTHPEHLGRAFRVLIQSRQFSLRAQRPDV
jgi:SAM-dependent MidA family methyltransferase